MLPPAAPVVEGVSNEVLIAAGILFVIAPVTVYLLVRFLCHNGQRIHPLSVTAIRAYLRSSATPQTLASAPVQTSRPGRFGSSDCAICLSPPTGEVLTNCGHTFCASCILGYWNHQGRPLGIPCPCCRQRVTLLHSNPGHLRQGQTQQSDLELMEFNRRASATHRTVLEIIRDTPALLRMLARTLFSPRGIVLLQVIRVLISPLLFMLTSLIYLVVPFDILPEGVFGVVGYIDDVALICISVIFLGYTARRLIQRF